MSKIIMKPIGDLTPYPNNPRTHSAEQVAQLVGSIQEFGFTAPVLINEKGVILAGHGRVEAAELAGLTKVPTLTLEGLTEAQQRAYVIADNKLTLNGGWDLQKLEAEMRALSAESFDIDLTGFSDAEMKRLLEKASKGDGDSGDGEQNFTISYTIIFDDTQQQDVWFGFLRHIKEEYPDEDTLAARLIRFLKGLDDGAV